MIVVFVVDTSPSMAAPSSAGSGGGGGGSSSSGPPAGGISRLDAAKMSVENLARSMDRRVVEHNRSVLSALMGASASPQKAAMAQDAGRLEQFDEFLLLSTGLQPDSTIGSSSSGGVGDPSSSFESIAAAAEAHASCGAGGRLLVGPVEDGAPGSGAADGGGGAGGGSEGGSSSGATVVPHPPDRSDFERELKRLRPAAKSSSSSSSKFPEWAGGARGLNAALSHGLGLLSRYRLTRGRAVEHFGMGRLPWTEHQMARLSRATTGGEQDGNAAVGANKYESPLQPACLVLLTDGECLRLPPEEGGGKLSLRFGNMPLRDFYKEPFRWDQRIFILHIAEASSPPLHKDLRALCEVTGGAYVRINPSAPSVSKIMPRIAPPKPKLHTIPDPLMPPNVPMLAPSQSENALEGGQTNIFINGGPICSFQCLEGGGNAPPTVHRAMILFAGACEQQRWILSHEKLPPGQTQKAFVQSPIWCVPESHFPSRKLDRLPPRRSQPLLHYSRSYQAVGALTFDPYFVMKALHHLDHLQVTIRQLLVDAGDSPPPIATRMLQRDVYVCDWVGGIEGAQPSGGPSDSSNNTAGAPRTVSGREHFPVCVLGAGRPALSGEGAENLVNIGILRVPHNWVRLKDASANNSTATDRLSTMTFVPPDAHILIPLLIKVAEMELRILKKAESKEARPKGGATAGLIKKKVSSAAAARAIHLDDMWKADFRAYLFRLPPYYLPAIRRVLRPMLPPSVLSLLNVDTSESLASLCFSASCLQMIVNGEKAAKDGNDWLRGMEQNLRMRKARTAQETQSSFSSVDANGLHQNVDFGYGQYDPRVPEHRYLNTLRNLPPPWRNGKSAPKQEDPRYESNPIALLPSSCLLPYYESRRRWIFGGTGLATRGLHVEGVNNDGTNSHHYSADQNPVDVPLIALAGCASTTNQTSIARMGDFKERISVAPVSFVDYGGNSASGAAITTTSDGAPKYSVDDDVLPLSFFDPATGEFKDSPQARERARLMISFGNPFQDKRGGTVVPEKFSSQRPSLHEGENGPTTPPGSPPHDAYDSHSPIEGEGEAAFTGKRPASTSPPRSSRKLIDSNLLSLRKRSIPPPPGADEKRRKGLPANGKHSDAKAKPNAPPIPSSPQPPPPRPRPPPPRRQSQSKPGPPSAPPKPKLPQQQSQKEAVATKPLPPKPAPPKPAPPKPVPPKPTQPARPGSDQASRTHPHAHQTAKHTPQKSGTAKPAPPKRQNSDGVASTDGVSSPIPTSGQQKPPQPQQDLALQLQNPGAKPKMNLPEGWICVWSKSQKRWYFFDTKTNKSVWDPEHIKASH